jgi:hypothetical protein
MRGVPEEEYPEFVRRLREQARRDAEELVPRPGFPVFGLATPSLTPASVSESMKTNGEWTLITLTYARAEDVPAGPYAEVTTLAVPSDDDEPAIDETLRHAMLDERVPSERAQYLWARYWVSRMTGSGPDPGPDEVIARAAARERFESDLMAAWDAWAAKA